MPVPSRIAAAVSLLLQCPIKFLSWEGRFLFPTHTLSPLRITTLYVTSAESTEPPPLFIA